MSQILPLWDWALAAYARPGAESLFIDLQDGHGQSTPFLLWAAWMADQGRAAPQAVLIEGAGIARAWEGEIVGPLRQVRRRLKAAGAEALRQQVKTAELEAERAVMLALEALAAPPGPRVPVADALAAAGRAWNPPADPDAIKLLARVLG